MESHGNWLMTPLVLLAAAVLAVPLARGLKLGAILGYLVAGVLLGPQVLGLISHPSTVLEIGEFGVVLMMFLVGLELEPKRLWAMRRPIFGWGSAQMLGCAALLLVPAFWLDSDWHTAVIAALGLAMSSTAVALAVLAERNLGGTRAGQSVISVALLQDIAAIPVLALVPLLASQGRPAGGHNSAKLWLALGALVAIVLGGRLLLRPLLRWIARSGTPEIFTAASLLLVLGTAALMQKVGLSMALGAFAAGVLLAESEYRRALEADLEPFKGLLLGMFFIAVGMGLDLTVLWERPLVVLGLLAALWICKGLVLYALSRLMDLPKLERPVFVILLAQGGEFGFVVFQLAEQATLLDAAQRSVLVAAVALSLALTPALLAWVQRRAGKETRSSPHELKEQQESPVIIAGFGRYGQIIGRVLNANGVSATVLDHDADTVESLRRFGWRVFWGDATRLELLRIAGAERAHVLVIAVDDVNHSLKIAELAKEQFPHLQVVARARNVQHYYALRDLGVSMIERETLDSALMSARSVMENIGWTPHAARQLAMRFRRHSVEQMEAMRPHRGDMDTLIAMSKQGRQQLEERLAQERRAMADGQAARPWQEPEQQPQAGKS
ncbi:glutathione-regulated potassium-efflux system protein KefC [Roseateles terrae]|uniref:Glutathione-regulated potassium-efflux system ancillary protein KefC n=1 Tax=Roseateles terrae TaxID=431060 RepID=A0ABR6GWT6_9BURK|nr:glutathione-regulated potassium-efflux system protein KefC [Roseateles terrae]MBB3196579.1 glutathione-regulated potassium-efflux system ancillary protein KefC [Roseateles terrae]OWQ84839.1 glutathione-regulated potassium-efflux system protein KefC [Roseateles terrae]